MGVLRFVQIEQTGGDDQQESHTGTPAKRDIRNDGGGSDGRGRRGAICDAEAAQIDWMLQGVHRLRYGSMGGRHHYSNRHDRRVGPV